MKTIFKKTFSGIILSMLFGCALFPLYTYAANPAMPGNDFESTKTGTEVNSFSQFDVGNVAADPREIVKRIINVVMGFLGMLAVLIILWAGFRWMTAGGNKENMEKAQQLLVNGIIGLVIVFSAWTVAWFAVNTIKINVGAA